MKAAILMGLLASVVIPRMHAAVYRGIDSEVLPDALSFVKFLQSNEFDPKEVDEKWDKYYEDNYSINLADPHTWERSMDYILNLALLTNSTSVLRSMLDLTYPMVGRVPIFNPDRALFLVAYHTKIDEEAAGRMARILMEYGANPMKLAHTKNPLLNGLTVVEIAIRHESPTVLQAFLSSPSPLYYETLEAMADSSKNMRRGIEIYRTTVVREALDVYERVSMSRSVNSRTDMHDLGRLESIVQVLKNEKFFVFASLYLNQLIYFLYFIIFISLFVQFLFNLRVKRVPIDSELTLPRKTFNDNNGLVVWQFGKHFISTLVSTVPTASFSKCSVYGIVTMGSVVWSTFFTGRSDISAVLVLFIILQSLFTLMCYYTYAPISVLNDDTVEDFRVARVMFYPKWKDWSRAVGKSTLFLTSCCVSTVVLFKILDPITRMYWCPAISISDTYGFAWTWMRIFAICWDILIFFTLTFRIQTCVETILVYNLFDKLTSEDKSAADEGEEMI